MTKPAAIYARVSTDEQAKGFSLPTQREACRTYALERGYTVTDEFSDDYTGESMDRPGLNLLRESVRRGESDAVIVYELDRLARKMVYQILIEEELNKAGAVIEYVNGQYSDSDEGRLQKHIRASIAEYERAKIKERTMRGRRGKIEAGYIPGNGRGCFGYRIKGQGRDTRLEVFEDEAITVRQIFRLFTTGDDEGPLGTTEIANRLTAMGVPSAGDTRYHGKQRGRGVWSRTMVHRILREETVAGVYYAYRYKSVDGDKPNTRKEIIRPREEWVGIPVEAIVDRPTWDAAQRRLNEGRQQSRRNTIYEYLLGRRITCVCGYKVHATPVKGGKDNKIRYFYYRCNGRDRKSIRSCALPMFSVASVDRAVWAWLEELLLDPAALTAGLRASQARAEEANHGLHDRLATVGSQIATYDSQLARLLDLYIGGSFERSLLDEKRASLEKIRASLESERIDLEAHLSRDTLTDEQIADIQYFAAEVRSGLQASDFATKRDIVELLNVSGKLAVEQGQRVVHVRCEIGSASLSPMSASSSTWRRPTPHSWRCSRPTKSSSTACGGAWCGRRD